MEKLQGELEAARAEVSNTRDQLARERLAREETQTRLQQKEKELRTAESQV